MFTKKILSKLPSSTIKFAKGSYCGSYAGNLNSGRILNISLGANQEIRIDSDAYIASVRDSKGNLLVDQGVYDYRYVTKNKGNHAIRIMVDRYNYVQVCAY